MDTTQHIFRFVDEINWLTILKILSVGINFFILIKWIRSKIVLNRFLVGRWEGNIVNAETEARLKCILIVSECAGRDNKAFFYYEQFDNDEITVRGGDELDDYDSDRMFICNRQWKPVFFRQFHVGYNENAEKKVIDFSESIRYEWHCQIQNIWTRPKLKITIVGNSINLNGKLHKS